MVSEEKVEPASASEDGRRNAYYITCNTVGQKRPYAACLAHIDDRIGGLSNCCDAIRNKSCPALAMRQEERLQGKAIYFIQRTLIGEIVGRVRDWITPVKGEPSPTKPPPKGRGRKTSGDSREGLVGAVASAGSVTYADAINEAAKSAPEAARSGVTTPASSSALRASFVQMKVQPGESPLEAARRIAAMRKVSQQ